MATATLPKNSVSPAGRPIPQHDEIILSQSGLPQNRILRRNVEAQRLCASIDLRAPSAPLRGGINARRAASTPIAQ